jgi:hypothetical protein
MGTGIAMGGRRRPAPGIDASARADRGHGLGPVAQGWGRGRRHVSDGRAGCSRLGREAAGGTLPARAAGPRRRGQGAGRAPLEGGAEGREGPWSRTRPSLVHLPPKDRRPGGALLRRYAAGVPPCDGARPERDDPRSGEAAGVPRRCVARGPEGRTTALRPGRLTTPADDGDGSSRRPRPGRVTDPRRRGSSALPAGTASRSGGRPDDPASVPGARQGARPGGAAPTAVDGPRGGGTAPAGTDRELRACT